VQRGQICTNGTTCSAGRNLLDFNDITVDKTGHAVIGYSDGCTATCVTSNKVSNNKQTSAGVIARQISGPLLFVPPAASPVVKGTNDPTKGSPLSGSSQQGTSSSSASSSGTSSASGSGLSTGGRSLASTGLDTTVPAAGAVILLLAAATTRRRLLVRHSRGPAVAVGPVKAR